jgi:O-antigen ligase
LHDGERRPPERAPREAREQRLERRRMNGAGFAGVGDTRVVGSGSGSARHDRESTGTTPLQRLVGWLLLAGTTLLWFLPVEPAPSDLLWAGALAACAGALATGAMTLTVGPAQRALLAFAVLQFLPALWAVAPLSAWFYGTVTAFLVFAALALATLDPHRLAHAYTVAATIAGGIVLLLFMAQVAGLPTAALDVAYRALAGASASGADTVVPGLFFGSRPKGFFKDPNVVGAFLATATLLPAARLLLARDGRTARRAALLALFLSAATAATLSRAAVLALAAGGGVLLGGLAIAGRLAPRRLAALLAGGATLAGLAALAVLGSEAAGERFLQLNAYDFDRAATWWRGLEAFVAQPLGHGPGMFLLATTSGGFGEPYAAHSTWVRLLAENGAPGFLSFVAVMAIVSWRLLRHARRADVRAATDTSDAALTLLLWSFAALAATLLESFVIDTLHWRHLWVLVGLAAGIAVPSPGRAHGVARS